MKGCLKLPSPLPSPALPDCPHSRKCVAFEAKGCEQVFFADEWDRTPTEPTRRLSYQDLMELKEIQGSLPLANQPPDPITGRPGRHYLSNVPISLLPLLPSKDSDGQGQCHRNGVSALNGGNGHYSDGHGSPNHNGHRLPGYHNTNGTNGAMDGQGLHGSSARPTHRNLIAAANKPRPAPPNHLAMPTPRTTNNMNLNVNHPRISNPFAQRPKTNFTFLPLLDTPPPSSAESSVPSSQTTTPSPSNPSSRSTSPDLTSDTDHTDPPTPSLTNASLDSPVSCASSLVSWSPEPTFLQLPPKHLSCLNTGHFGPVDSYFPVHTGESEVDVGDYMSSDRHSQFGAPLVRRSSGDSEECKTPTAPSSKPFQKRNVIVVNDVEIEMDEDEVKPTPAPPMKRKKNVIIVNDVEIELDGDEDEEEVSTRSLPLSDDAPSIHCNSTENLKPPENKSDYEINAGRSFSPPPSSSVSSSARRLSFLSSTCPLASCNTPGRTTLGSDMPCARSNLGSTSGGELNAASSTGLGLELNLGATSAGIGTESKSTTDASVGSTREPSMGPSTGPRSGAASSTSLGSFSTVTRRPCPTTAVGGGGADATGFGSLHMPMRFKRHPAKVNAMMVSADAVISL